MAITEIPPYIAAIFYNLRNLPLILYSYQRASPLLAEIDQRNVPLNARSGGILAFHGAYRFHL